MVLTFFTMFFGEQLFSFFPQVYRIFNMMFKQPIIWLSLLFCAMITSIFEILYDRMFVSLKLLKKDED